MSATLKKITARAKLIRKRHPSMKWTNAIKQSSAELKRSGAIGKAAKKKPVKRKAVKRKKRVVKKLYQTGKSTRIYDERRKAKASGKRKSKSGRVYYERRKNRSDMPGSLSGTAILYEKLGALHVARERNTKAKTHHRLTKQITETRRKIRALKK